MKPAYVQCIFYVIVNFCGAFQVKASFWNKTQQKCSLLSLPSYFKWPVISESMCVYNFKSGNENALQTFKKISYVITREGEAHTDGEKLVKPCTFIWLHLWQTRKLPGKFSLCCYLTIWCREVQENAVIVLDELIQRLMLRESFAIEVFFVCVYCVDEGRFKWFVLLQINWSRNNRQRGFQKPPPWLEQMYCCWY